MCMHMSQRHEQFVHVPTQAFNVECGHAHLKRVMREMLEKETDMFVTAEPLEEPDDVLLSPGGGEKLSVSIPTIGGRSDKLNTDPMRMRCCISLRTRC